jgi:hypothetical protein
MLLLLLGQYNYSVALIIYRVFTQQWAHIVSIVVRELHDISSDAVTNNMQYHNLYLERHVADQCCCCCTIITARTLQI